MKQVKSKELTGRVKIDDPGVMGSKKPQGKENTGTKPQETKIVRRPKSGKSL